MCERELVQSSISHLTTPELWVLAHETELNSQSWRTTGLFYIPKMIVRVKALQQ